MLHYREDLECLQQFVSSLIDVLKPPKSILVKMQTISQFFCCQKSNIHKISHNSRAFLKSVQTSLHVVEGYFVTHHGLWYIILNQRIMALAMSKDFRIAPSAAEISGVWKFTVGLNHPVAFLHFWVYFICISLCQFILYAFYSVISCIDSVWFWCGLRQSFYILIACNLLLPKLQIIYTKF